MKLTYVSCKQRFYSFMDVLKHVVKHHFKETETNSIEGEKNKEDENDEIGKPFAFSESMA